MLRFLRFSRRISEDRRSRLLLLAAAVAAVALLLISLPSGGGRATTADGAGPGGAQTLMFGDANCDGAVDSLDALANLLAIANLTVPQQDPCPEIMSDVLINGEPSIWGDENCKDGKDSIDALILLLLVAHLPRPASAPGCPELGDEVAVIHGTATPSPSPTPEETGTATPTPTPTPTPSAEPTHSGSATPTPTETPTPTASPSATPVSGDIKVLTFGTSLQSPFNFPVQQFVPRAITFEETKHNNGPHPLTALVNWGLELSPSTTTDVNFRWAAEPGDTCSTNGVPVPCGEGDTAGQPSLNGDNCLDGVDNDGDTKVDFMDTDCNPPGGGGSPLAYIDHLLFPLDLAVSVGLDLTRDVSVQCDAMGTWVLDASNVEEPLPPATDPDMNNNDQQAQINGECQP